MKITVLGSGASLGTPTAGGFWGVCDPNEPRNERTRASILVQSESTNIIVDATYDLRIQLNRLQLKNVDAVLLSHAHSDHVNGLDDLRAISYHHNKLIDVYSNQETIDEIASRWPYMFEETRGGIYKPFLKPKIISRHQKFSVGNINIESFEQDHLTCVSLGYRFDRFAYSVDVANLSDKSLQALQGVDVWMVDAVAYHKEKITTHANLKRVIEWVDILKPKITYLTVLNTYMDYHTLCNELPPHIRPAHDGMEINL